MSYRLLVLIALLVASLGLLVHNWFLGHADDPAATRPAKRRPRADSDRKTVHPGEVIWANWHEESKKDPEEEEDPWALTDARDEPEAEPAIPEEHREKIRESFRGMDVVLPRPEGTRKVSNRRER